VRTSRLWVAAAATAWIAATAAAAALVVHDSITPADAILVLAGSGQYVARATAAARLYATGAAPQVLLTDDGVRRGWSTQAQDTPRMIDLASDVLVAHGVPPARVIKLPRVESTHDEAVVTMRAARREGLRSVIVVTSPYHTRRARWMFDRVLKGAGVSVAVLPSDPSSWRSLMTWWATARGWQMVAGEYIKLPYYWIRYR
jgi:uncharacterized SAM-binding protein YcdF (DUF218 family)